MTSKHFLDGTRVYLSGPMDFVASRANEKKFGWRNRVGEFLRSFGVTVFDPWFKPEVRRLHDYGQEGINTTGIRNKWTFAKGRNGAEARAKISGKFYETMHIDLRMVDTSDFIVAYCPTNIYSVGTPHELIMARLQRKPVLFVSPSISIPSLEKLQKHLKNDKKGTNLLNQLLREEPIKENIKGVPSLWYMPLIGGEGFFDGFGFKKYIKKFKWKRIPLDDHEEKVVLKNPLLPFLESLSKKHPQKWDNRRKKFTHNDDWIIWNLEKKKDGTTLKEKLVR